MDIERTMEFILSAQAKAEIRMDKMDKRIDGIAKLLHQGMRILVKVESAQQRTEARVAELFQAQKRTETTMAELAEAQKQTQRSLKAFLDSVRHRRNGN